MTIKILIDESNSTPEERESFYQQPIVGTIIDEFSGQNLPEVQLRVLSAESSDTIGETEFTWK